jgi:hypothetical protein
MIEAAMRISNNTLPIENNRENFTIRQELLEKPIVLMVLKKH